MGLIATLTADAGAAPDGSATGGGYSGGRRRSGPRRRSVLQIKVLTRAPIRALGSPVLAPGRLTTAQTQGLLQVTSVDFYMLCPASEPGGPLHIWLASCGHSEQGNASGLPQRSSRCCRPLGEGTVKWSACMSVQTYSDVRDALSYSAQMLASDWHSFASLK